MAKFMNTHYKDTVNSLVDGYLGSINNPYYMFTENKPTLVTYYNTNLTKSSLDESLKVPYSTLGKDSPLKFNKIKDFYLYGIDKIVASLDAGEYGIESSPIEGEAIILPNTIVPVPNDYFTINYDKNKILFKVLSVDVDTIDNDNNFFKITYKIDRTIDGDIEIFNQVENEYTMIVDNIGSQFKAIIQKDKFELMMMLDEICVKLKNYYKALFYSDRVQSFILDYKSKYFYDPFLIEFLIRNNILNNSGEYLYIQHQLNVCKTFPLDYDKTFFRFIEHSNLKKDKPLISSQAKYINDDTSLFSTRIENYFKIYYIGSNDLINTNEYIIYNFDPELLDRIYSNKKYQPNDYRNIIIKYMNDEQILNEDIETLENIKFEHCINLFYQLPILIYILTKECDKTYKK